METSIIIILCIGLAIVIAACVGIALIRKGAKRRNAVWRGREGENYIRSILADIAERFGGRVINDYITQGQRISVQIDHIFINENGVFVLETKNYSGYIYGTENQDHWTQVLAHGRVKQRINNPVKQNSGHIYAVRKIIGKNFPIVGAVVMVQSNVQNIKAQNVLCPEWLPSFLTARRSEVKLTEEEQLEAYEKLSQARIMDLNIDEKHIQEVREMVYGVENNLTCPRCGGNLVLRQGKYKAFYGCSNYPKCKFTKNP